MKERKCCPPVTVLFLTNSKDNTARISPYSHEEADTRLLLHALDSGKEGCRKVMLRTVVTPTLWRLLLHFSVDWTCWCWKASHYIAIHEIAATLGQEKCEALPFFSRVHRHPNLLVGGRVLPGIPGWHIKKPQMYPGP